MEERRPVGLFKYRLGVVKYGMCHVSVACIMCFELRFIGSIYLVKCTQLSVLRGTSNLGR